jgi:hypothetical protein
MKSRINFLILLSKYLQYITNNENKIKHIMNDFSYGNFQNNYRNIIFEKGNNK